MPVSAIAPLRLECTARGMQADPDDMILTQTGIVLLLRKGVITLQLFAQLVLVV